MYTFSRNTLPTAIMELFTTNDNIHNYNAGNRSKLRHPFGTRENIYKTSSFRAAYIWNHVVSHSHINILTNYSTFKLNLKL